MSFSPRVMHVWIAFTLALTGCAQSSPAPTGVAQLEATITPTATHAPLPPTDEPPPPTSPPHTPTSILTSEPTPTEAIATSGARTATPQAASPSATPTASNEPTTLPAATNPPAQVNIAERLSFNTALILDASGSMLADLDGQTRLLVAQDAIGILSASLPAAMNTSLWVYGHRIAQDNQAESCLDIEEVIPLGPIDVDTFDRMAHSFPARGYTPITEALRRTAATLPIGTPERNTIILVSDGEETCHADPCATAAELYASNARITIHAVGLAVDDVTRAQLECIASQGGGSYAGAENAEQLAAALITLADESGGDQFAYVPGLQQPTVVLTSPDDRHVYVTSFAYSAVLAFERDQENGMLSLVHIYRNQEQDISAMDTPFGMTITSDGRHLYVTGDEQQSITTFARDADTGELSHVATTEHVFDGIQNYVNRIYGIASSSDGRHLYAVGQHFNRRDDALAVFSRDPDSGQLTRTQLLQQGVDIDEGLSEATDVTVSPDDHHVYVIGHRQVGVFARDPQSGALTYVQTILDGRDVSRGLLDGARVQVSGDGLNVYTTATRGSSLIAFDRDAEAGRLTFKSQVIDHAGEPPTDRTHNNLQGTHGLALSPDGRHIYVAGAGADALVVLAHDADTGELNFVAEHRDNTAGVDGLQEGWSVAITPDGLNVYVAAFGDAAVSVFRRDPASGHLAFIQLLRERPDQ